MTAATTPHRARLAVTSMMVVLVAGCGSGSTAAPTPAPSPLTAAPEPATAPPQAAALPGRVVAVPEAAPEGLAYDPVAGLAVIALRDPGRLALLDPADPGSARTVDVGGAARHLQLAAPGGPVLVPTEDTDLLVEVSLPAGTVTARTPVARQPHDAAAIGRTRLVCEELAGSLAAVVDGQVTTRITGLLQPGGVGVAAGRFGAVDVRGRTLTVVDPEPFDTVATLPAGAGPTHAIGLGGDLLVVADTDGGALLVYRLSGAPELVQTVPLAAKPYGLAVDTGRGQLYVTTTADNQLHAFAITTDGITPGRSWAAVEQPNSAAVIPATGEVLIGGAARSELQILDPAA